MVKKATPMKTERFTNTHLWQFYIDSFSLELIVGVDLHT